MIKAIETVYKGYRFRSRLEARWAVFLDALQIRWTYEPEGFDLNGTWYLPDFWVAFEDDAQYPYPDGHPQERGVWLEIKPTFPDIETIRKCMLLCVHTGHTVHLISGNIGLGEFEVRTWRSRGRHEKHISHYNGLLECDAFNFDIGFEACPNANLPLKNAYALARSARFEHGESGATV